MRYRSKLAFVLSALIAGTGIGWLVNYPARASGLIQSAYNLIQNGGTPIARQPTINFVNGGCVDNSGSNRSDCTFGSSSGLSNVNIYSQSFTTQTSVTLTDNAGTITKFTQCYDASSPPNWIIPQNTAITNSNNVTVTFGANQSGKCFVIWSATSLALNTATKTGAYTFAASDYLIVGDTTGGSFSVKLEAAPMTGQIHVLKKSAAPNTLTLDGNGANVDGTATIAITTQYTSYTVQFDGSQWWIE